MRETINIRIKKLHSDAIIPTYAHKGDAGFDLVAVEDTIISPGETVLIPTGLAFEIPSGYEMQLRPRSGISLKTGLRLPNSPATIDSGYRGEVKIILENTNKSIFTDYLVGLVDGSFVYITEDNEEIPYIVGKPYPYKYQVSYLIRKGDRIAQGVINRLPLVVLTEVSEIDETERNTGGFGSTGVQKEGKILGTCSSMASLS